MNRAPSTIVRLVLGLIMFGLGAFVAVRPLVLHSAALTGSLWLDMAFAVFFILRGAMHVRRATRG